MFNSFENYSYEEMFLFLVQSSFCKKHNVNKKEYNTLMDKYLLGNSYNSIAIDDDIELSNLVFNFDSYLEKDLRSKTGSYYTPVELADAMVKRVFADYFIKNNFLSEDKCEDLFFYDINRLTREEEELLIDNILTVKIIDISSGTGVFLYNSLLTIIGILNVLSKNVDIKDIINLIYAADLQSKPLEIYIILIYDYLLNNNIPISELPILNISCQDSIEYKVPFETKFDIVIGNPPYLGEKGNKELFARYKKLESTKDYYEGRMDLFYFFIYRGHELLSENGLLSYLTSNYFITADGASRLRKYIKDNTYVLRLINFDECRLFSDAQGMHNLIFTLSNTNNDITNIQYINKLKKEFKKEDIYTTKYQVKNSSVFSEDNNIVIYESDDYFNIIDKIINKSAYRLDEISSINQGIVSGADRVTNNMLVKKFTNDSIEKNKIVLDEGIFVHDESSSLNSKYFRPFYKNSDIDNYFTNKETSKRILYINDCDLLLEEDLEWKHLIRYYDVLSKRREVEMGRRKWYSLQWGREESIFEGEKIVAPQRSLKNKFAYSTDKFYSSADIYYITKTELPTKYLLAILNSKLMFFWLYNRGKRKGKNLELYAKPISQIPILLMNEFDMKMIITYVEEILNGDNNSKDLIDEVIYKYYNITDEEKILIEELYNN